MNETPEPTLADTLEAATLAIQRGDDVETSPQAASLNAEAQDLVSIIAGLDRSLKPLQPKPEFARRLKRELIAGDAPMVDRLRQRPARLHLAAVLALIAGFCLLAWRRIFGSDGAQDISDEPIATPL